MISRDEALLHSRLKRHQRQIDRSREIIEASLVEFEKPYVAFSGGKDSIVTLELVREQAPNIPSIFFDAACSYPETYEVMAQYSERGPAVRILQTEPFLETLRQYGLDHPNIGGITRATTVEEPTIQLQHEEGYDAVFLGLRAQESRDRTLLAATKGPIYFSESDGMIKSCPVMYWSDADIWAFIHSRALPYNRAYDKGVDRISYWAGTTNIRRGRWLELKRHWPGLFNSFAAEFPEITQYV